MPNRNEKRIDLTDWAYNSIKMLILNNTLPAGTQIHIDQMAARLGISRTPVREALQRLENIELVRIQPHVGCFVNGSTPQEFKEVFELRWLIERYAAKKAATALTDEMLAVFSGYIQNSELAVQQGSLDEFNRCEILIHNLLIDNLHNRRISQIMDTVSDNIYRERCIALTSLDNIKQSVAEHRLIEQALYAHDPELAEKAMGDHIAKVEERITKIAFPEE